MIDNSSNFRAIITSIPYGITDTNTSSGYAINGINHSYPNATNTSSATIGSNSSYTLMPLNADCCYIIFPNFGLQVYTQPHYEGSILLDVLNLNVSPQVFAPTTNGIGQSWKLFYYDGTYTQYI